MHHAALGEIDRSRPLLAQLSKRSPLHNQQAALQRAHYLPSKQQGCRSPHTRRTRKFRPRRSRSDPGSSAGPHMSAPCSKVTYWSGVRTCVDQWLPRGARDVLVLQRVPHGVVLVKVPSSFPLICLADVDRHRPRRWCEPARRGCCRRPPVEDVSVNMSST